MLTCHQLKHLDFYNFPIRFRINGYDSHRSILGIFLTFLLIGTFFTMGFFFGKDLLYRENPDITSVDEFVLVPPRINIGRENNPLMIGMMDGISWKYFYDPTIFYGEVSLTTSTLVTYQNGTKDTQIERETHRAVPCTRNHFNLPDLNQYLDAMNLENFLCIDYDKYKLNPHVEGNLDFNYYAGIEFMLYKCVDTDEIKCQPREEIDKIFEFYYTYIFYADVTVDATKFDRPFQYYLANKYYTKFDQACTQVFLYYQGIELLSDVGYLLEDYKSLKTTKLSEKTPTIIKHESLFYVFLEVALTQTTYIRRYKKLSRIFAQVGGFINLVILITTVPFSFFLSTHYLSTLSEKLGFFKDRELSQNRIRRQSQRRQSQKRLSLSPLVINNRKQILVNQQQKQQIQLGQMSPPSPGRDEGADDYYHQYSPEKRYEKHNDQKTISRNLTRQLEDQGYDPFTETKYGQFLNFSEEKSHPLNFLEVISFSFPFCRNERRQKFLKRAAWIQSKLNIQNYLLSLNQLDIITHLFMTKDQIAVLNFIQNKEPDENIVFEAYKRIRLKIQYCQNPQREKISAALIRLINPSTRKTFDENISICEINKQEVSEDYRVDRFNSPRDIGENLIQVPHQKDVVSKKNLNF